MCIHIITRKFSISTETMIFFDIVNIFTLFDLFFLFLFESYIFYQLVLFPLCLSKVSFIFLTLFLSVFLAVSLSLSFTVPSLPRYLSPSHPLPPRYRCTGRIKKVCARRRFSDISQISPSKPRTDFISIRTDDGTSKREKLKAKCSGL